MDGKGIMSIALLGGAGYLVYQAMGKGSTSAPASGSGGQPPAAGSAPAAPSSATPPAGGSAPPSLTTPTVTAPVVQPVNASTLGAAAAAQGLGGSLSPDQWNWLVVYVLKGPAFSLDAFGDVSNPIRTANYAAQDFMDIATGAKVPSVPAPDIPATAQTCPPDCGSDPVSALTQILQAAAPGVAQYNADQWNWFLNGYYDVEALFGPVGTMWRDSGWSARDFAGIVTGQVASPASRGMSGLGRNPILRPNMPNPARRWVHIPSVRPVSIGMADTKGGWAV